MVVNEVAGYHQFLEIVHLRIELRTASASILVAIDSKREKPIRALTQAMDRHLLGLQMLACAGVAVQLLSYLGGLLLILELSGGRVIRENHWSRA